jgi:diaminopimelate dehydrogenase
MRPLRLAIIGGGRLGRACASVVHGLSDVVAAGIVQPTVGETATPHDAASGRACVGHISELGEIDAALVCVPTEVAPGVAHELLQARVPIVECASFDGDALARHHQDIAHAASRHRVAAVVGAGWDPGVLPQLQRLFEQLIPKGRSQVSRHVAAAAHHTAAAKGAPGVEAALCSELHEAGGPTKRYVYVQLTPGADLEPVRRHIESDPVFADSSTQVLVVDDVADFERDQQGVLVERLGEGTAGPHASLILEARCDPTLFTARLMIDAARALPLRGRGAFRYTPFGLLPVPVSGPATGRM